VSTPDAVSYGIPAAFNASMDEQDERVKTLRVCHVPEAAATAITLSYTNVWLIYTSKPA
jgi:hypothetical protein